MGSSMHTSPSWLDVLLGRIMIPYCVAESLWRKAYRKTARYERKKEEKRLKELARMYNPPPVIKRPRRLTISEEANTISSESKLRTESQDQSQFFNLPYEIRLAIYEAVIGDQDHHFVFKSAKLHSFRCTTYATNSRKPWHCSKFPRDNCWKDTSTLNVFRNDTEFHPPSWVNVLPLMQTCRSIYSEFTQLLYTRPTFIFHNWTSLLAFSGSILPQRFQSLRSIRIDGQGPRYGYNCAQATRPFGYDQIQNLSTLHIRNELPTYTLEDHPICWTAMCDILSRMSGLRRLDIFVSEDSNTNPWGSSAHDGKVILGSLVDIGHKLNLRNYTVGIAWKEKDTSRWHVPEDTPFVFLRRPPPWKLECRESIQDVEQ